jgi:beta-phosphoglucomutase-like phosphatase (HAD superfamily)
VSVAPSRVVVVEDTPTGIVAAKAAGMFAIGFAGMTPASRLLEAGANVVVSDMPQLQARLAAQ